MFEYFWERRACWNERHDWKRENTTYIRWYDCLSWAILSLSIESSSRYEQLVLRLHLQSEPHSLDCNVSRRCILDVLCNSSSDWIQVPTSSSRNTRSTMRWSWCTSFEQCQDQHRFPFEMQVPSVEAYSLSISSTTCHLEWLWKSCLESLQEHDSHKLVWPPRALMSWHPQESCRVSVRVRVCVSETRDFERSTLRPVCVLMFQ